MEHTEKLSGFTTLKQIAYDVRIDTGAPERFYQHFIRWAVRAYTDMSIYHIFQFEEAKLEMSDINRISAPDDFASLVSLAVPSKGRNFYVDRNHDIVTTTTTVDDEETLDTTEGEGVAIEPYLYMQPGMHGGNNQYYYTEVSPGIYQINGTPQTTIVMRYVSSGINLSGKTYIPILYNEAIVAKIKTFWFRRTNTAINKIDDADMTLDIELRKIRHAQMPSMDELRGALYSSYRYLKR